MDEDGENKIAQDESLLVGVGGWAYLPIKAANKLEVCARLYDFVEVNSTFYDLPEIDQVKRWRRSVPESFEFTVRASRKLTHESHLEPTNRNFKIFDRMSEICRELDARILHFQFPPSLKLNENILSQWENFFASVYQKGSRGIKYAIEARGSDRALGSSPAFQKLVDKYDLIPTTDASKSDPVPSPSGVLYTRVFGQGEHTRWTFDSSELSDLAKKIGRVSARRKYVTFHNMTMYEDASRFKTVAKTGKDQDLSPRSPIGFESLKRAISTGRLAYPITKQALISEFGWKTYDAEPYKKEHVSKALEKLPEREYSSPDEVVQALD
jgi:uncharacterized protein YecE (DUF72 family)